MGPAPATGRRAVAPGRAGGVRRPWPPRPAGPPATGPRPGRAGRGTPVRSAGGADRARPRGRLAAGAGVGPSGAVDPGGRRPADHPGAGRGGAGHGACPAAPGTGADPAGPARRRLPQSVGDLGARARLPWPGHAGVPGQVRVRLGARSVYLDVYAEREQVDVELDGATTHGDPRQREVDLRRDALLATRGILVVRFARRRLVHEVTQVRREILAILASRRG
ncbi:DUF559 domain-containing protein [Micromonospora fluostatini]|uniref:DUF559 domain-containing protein n=1 Tax=Micromonospora sp. JCM 30529 TaxID=3421643 RepID=UPI003D17825D